MMRFLALAVMPLVLAGCAGEQGGAAVAGGGDAADACFWPSQISGFSDAGPQKAIVRAGTQRMWELTLARECPDVDWALSIGIRPRGGQTICPGRPAEVVIPTPSGLSAQRCLVTNIRPLSDAEVLETQGRTPDQSKR